jgi:hypothetical protein
LKHYFYFNDVVDRKEPEIIEWSEKELNMTNNYDLSQIHEDVKNKIKEKIALIKWLNCHPELVSGSIIHDKWDKLSIKDSGSSPEWQACINDDSKLVLDLFFDSLDAAEIKSYVQANFPWASNPPITDLKTVWDLLVMAVWKSKSYEKLKDCEWGENKMQIVNLVEKLNY